MPKKSAVNAKAKMNSKYRGWQILTVLIQNYASASVAESWKGGGDPCDIDTLDLRLKLARTELNAHIQKMQREFDV
jgi:hypothetical protein